MLTLSTVGDFEQNTPSFPGFVLGAVEWKSPMADTPNSLALLKITLLIEF